MKKISFPFFLLVVSQFTWAQGEFSVEKERELEVGITLMTLNSFNLNYLVDELPKSSQFLNELFVRYKLNRFSLRARSSYHRNRNEIHTKRYSSNILKEDFRIGPGVQCSFFKKKDWLYGFIDVSYRYIRRSGYAYGGMTRGGLVNSHSNNVYWAFGIGSKLKITKRFFISPEIGTAFNYQFNSGRKQLYVDWYKFEIKLPITFTF